MFLILQEMSELPQVSSVPVEYPFSSPLSNNACFDGFDKFLSRISAQTALSEYEYDQVKVWIHIRKSPSEASMTEGPIFRDNPNQTPRRI